MKKTLWFILISIIFASFVWGGPEITQQNSYDPGTVAINGGTANLTSAKITNMSAANLILTTNPLAITGGGTGATASSNARSNLGLGSAALNASQDFVASNGGILKLSTSLSANTFQGGAVNLVAASLMALGNLCYIDSSSQAALADADSSATMPGIVLATAATNATATGIFALPGSIISIGNLSPLWTTGGIVYAGSGANTTHTAGALSQVVPNGSGDQVQVIGIAAAANILLFQPAIVLVEVQ